MKRLLLPVMSESQPPNNLTKLARPSLKPEINPIARPVPPRLVIRNGKSGVMVSLPMSLIRLELPRRYTFFSLLFFFFILFLSGIPLLSSLPPLKEARRL